MVFERLKFNSADTLLVSSIVVHLSFDVNVKRILASLVNRCFSVSSVSFSTVKQQAEPVLPPISSVDLRYRVAVIIFHLLLAFLFFSTAHTEEKRRESV